MLTGMTIADVLHRMYPEQFHVDKMMGLLGSQKTVERMERGDAPAEIVAGWAGELEQFREMRAKYLLYR